MLPIIEAAGALTGTAKVAAVAGAAGTTATSAVEVASLAGATAATAVEAGGALSAGAKATEVIGSVTAGTPVATEIAGLTPDILAAREVAGLATAAEISPNVGAAEQAIKELASLPNAPSKAPIEGVPSDPLTDVQEVSAKVKGQDELEAWKNSHPSPDPKVDPEGYKSWCEAYENSEIEFIAKAKSDILMESWDRNNPEPTDKGSEKHKEWEAKRQKQESEVAEKTKKEAKKLKENEKAGVLAEIRRLNELHSIRYDLVEGIKALKRKEFKTDEDKANIAILQNRKISIDGEIKLIENDLKMKAGTASPLVSLLIASALAGLVVYKIGQSEGAI